MSKISTISLAVILVLTLCSCGASVGPLEESEVRASILGSLKQVDSGIEREDAFLASAPAGELFRMNNNIAVRYSDGNFEGSGPDALRGVYSKAFNRHANILHTMTLTELVVSGEVATATVEVEFNSLREDKVPPENFTSTSTDILVFTLDHGKWKIRSWEEPPVEEPAT